MVKFINNRCRDPSQYATGVVVSILGWVRSGIGKKIEVSKKMSGGGSGSGTFWAMVSVLMREII